MSFPFPIFTGCTPITETIIPTSDVQISGWSVLGGPSTAWQATDLEGGAGDNDSVWKNSIITSATCGSTDSAVDFEVHLGNPSGTPGKGSCQGLRIDWRVADLTGTCGQCAQGCVRWTAELIQGTTVKATDTGLSLGDIITTQTYNLTEAEVDAISDHTDLRFRISVEVGKQSGFPIGPDCFVQYLGADYYER